MIRSYTAHVCCQTEDCDGEVWATLEASRRGSGWGLLEYEPDCGHAQDVAQLEDEAIETFAAVMAHDD